MTMDPVTGQVASAFVLAGAWIGAATVLAERLGARIGGLIANLPSNIVISYIFIALGRDVAYAAQATAAVPVGMLVDTFFLVAFILLVNRGVLVAVIGSLGTWFVLAVIAAGIGAVPMVVSVPVYVVTAGLVWWRLERRAGDPAGEVARVRPRPATVLVRMGFAGSVVGMTVYLSHILPPYWVGLFSTFPAVLLSSMVILTLAQGPAFARATGTVLVLSSTNIVAYAAGIRWGYPAWGIGAGTVMAFAASAAWVWMLRPVVAGAAKRWKNECALHERSGS